MATPLANSYYTSRHKERHAGSRTKSSKIPSDGKVLSTDEDVLPAPPKHTPEDERDWVLLENMKKMKLADEAKTAEQQEKKRRKKERQKQKRNEVRGQDHTPSSTKGPVDSAQEGTSQDGVRPTGSTSASQPPPELLQLAKRGSLSEGEEVSRLARTADSPEDSLTGARRTAAEGRPTDGPTCMDCEAACFPSDFLLVTTDGSEDWCAKLWGRCFHCYNASRGKDAQPLAQTDFKRRARMAWTARKAKLQEKVGTIRSLRFGQEEAYFERVFPGATNADRRQLVLMRLRLLSSNTVKDFAEQTLAMDNEEMKANFTKGLQRISQEYRVALETAAKNATWTSGAGGPTLDADDINHLTMISSRQALPFLCRERSCLFAGDNSQWIPHATKLWYRCPLCKTHYRPWVVQANFVDAQKVIVTIKDDGTCEFIPCSWPNTHESKALSNFQELHYRGVAGADEVKGFLDKTAVKLDHLLHQYAIMMPRHQAFQHYDWTEKNSHMLGEATYPRTKHEHLIKNGFVGCQLKPEQCTKDKLFTQWEEFIALITNHYAGVAQLGL